MKWINFSMIIIFFEMHIYKILHNITELLMMVYFHVSELPSVSLTFKGRKDTSGLLQV